jgi:hypothetical protein
VPPGTSSQNRYQSGTVQMSMCQKIIPARGQPVGRARSFPPHSARWAAARSACRGPADDQAGPLGGETGCRPADVTISAGMCAEVTSVWLSRLPVTAGAWPRRRPGGQRRWLTARARPGLPEDVSTLRDQLHARIRHSGASPGPLPWPPARHRSEWSGAAIRSIVDKLVGSLPVGVSAWWRKAARN